MKRVTIMFAVAIGLTLALGAAPALAQGNMGGGDCACKGHGQGKGQCQGHGQGKGKGQGFGKRAGAGSGGQVTPAALDEAQKKGLRYMREEEKLARDVYITLGARWGHPTFENIQGAEQRHMNAIGNLLVRYGVDDPIKDDKVGVFQNKKLATLYKELIERGQRSLKDALAVGKRIEEIDIDDLLAELERDAPGDVERVYRRLLRGSNNHLDAFARSLEGL